MYTRHNDVPVYERYEGEIEAPIYNQVRLAQTRLQPALRLNLRGLKHLDLILQPDAWVVVDRVLNDVPVLAWTDFKTKSRSALHLPVKCQIRLYHAHARAIQRPVLEGLQALLRIRLEQR